MELLPHLLEILSTTDWSLNEVVAESLREPVRPLSTHTLTLTHSLTPELSSLLRSLGLDIIF
jgi:hypothetical protein